MSRPDGAAPERKPEWAPRIWEGCDFFAWMRLLFRNRFAVHFSLLYIAVIITLVSFFHTILKWVQEAIYGRQIRRTRIEHPPIFIVGHWRTGTTLLHELLILDGRHGYPNTYQCLEPNHFLLTEKFITHYLHFLMPKRRPMDNMKAGWDRPQEDEFALCMLGQPSPYLTVAFPNRPPQCQEYYDFAGVSDGRLRSWKRTFKQFIKQLTYKTGKRLVMKSPPHTGRLPVLQGMFPGALFIHIVRDPYVVFPSTMNLWRTFYRAHGLQKPNFEGLEDLVLTTFVRLHQALEKGKPSVPPERFHEVRYEDLVADPEGEMRKIYDRFGLGEWEAYLPRLREYLAAHKNYETNRYNLTPEQRDAVTRQWGPIMESYGYRCPSTAEAESANSPAGQEVSVPNG